jgi:hypothetical protein
MPLWRPELTRTPFLSCTTGYPSILLRYQPVTRPLVYLEIQVQKVILICNLSLILGARIPNLFVVISLRAFYPMERLVSSFVADQATDFC